MQLPASVARLPGRRVRSAASFFSHSSAADSEKATDSDAVGCADDCPPAEFAASLVEKCRSVDVPALTAAVAEAAQTAAYLESAASLHASPQVRGIPVLCVGGAATRRRAGCMPSVEPALPVDLTCPIPFPIFFCRPPGAAAGCPTAAPPLSFLGMTARQPSSARRRQQRQRCSSGASLRTRWGWRRASSRRCSPLLTRAHTVSAAAAASVLRRAARPCGAYVCLLSICRPCPCLHASIH